MIGQIVSRYKIVEKLGGGGMGEVYKAEDTKLGRFVALKFLTEAVAQDRKAVERFMLEARAAAALSHPHICTIHEIDEHEGVPFIAMEYLEGQNLKYAIAGKPMPVELVIEMGIQVAEALAAAHAKGITHRDIKPSNIFITQGGQIKVVDFGLAKLTAPQVTPASEEETIVADAPTQTADLTDSGTAMGTVAYMSPEQALGQPVDIRTDLFSLGAVLYEMITGRQAFPGSTQAAIFDRILNREPPTPTRLGLEVPYELEQTVQKALEKNKVLRYQSALEIHTDLRRVRRTIESGRSAPVPAADESYFQDQPVSGTAPVPTPGSGMAPWATPVSGTASTGIPATAVGVPATQVPSGAAPLATQPARPRRALWLVSTLLVVAIAAIVGLLLQRSKEPALTESDVLLLTDFINNTGDAVFDGTLKQALAIKLEESPYLNILPERQVQDTLRLMGRDASERVTPDIGREICERQGIKAMVTGEIAQLGASYVVTLNAAECLSGRSLAREQIEAKSKEEVLAAVGSAAVTMRQDLGESLASIQQFDTHVEQATTSSLEALKALNLAEEARDRGAEPESIPLFKRALEIDPDFALAHARLGTVYANLSEWDKAVDHKSRAYELRDRVTEPERLYITAHYHDTVTGELSELIESYELFKQTYPRDWIPANNLASKYNTIGWYHKAAEEAELALRLQPDHHLPYTNLSEAYRNLSRFEEAARVLDDAAARGIRSMTLYTRRYELAFLEGDTATMQSMLEAAAGDPRESDILILEAEAAAARGRLSDAGRLTRAAVESAKAHGFDERASAYLARSARWEAAFGNLEPAAEQARAAMEEARNRDSMPIGAIAFALAGETEEAEALIDELTRQFPTDTVIRSVWLPISSAALELQRENPEAAITLLEKAAPYERGNLIVIYLRGQAHLMAGRPRDARAEFQKILDLPGVAPTAPVHNLAHLGIARAMAADGNSEGARREFETFFAAMADADDGLPILEAARRDWAGLR